MINSDFHTFLENSDTTTSFERKKKIYELTNNLDINLLEDLRKEVIKYYKYKFEERLNKQKEEFGDFTKNEFGDSDSPTADYSYFVNTPNFSINEFIDNFLNKYEYRFIEDIIDKTSEFVCDLEELILLGVKLSKNAETSTVSEIEEPIDLGEASPTEKIIYLEKLGVIDFLHKKPPFNTSVSKLASVISTVIGEEYGTIQPMLNRMLNTKIEGDKRNPMNSKNTVSVVVNKLIEIRFKPQS